MQCFPDAEATLAQAASQAAEVQAVLDELAQQDLDGVADQGALRIAPWSALPPARRRNALQVWLRGELGRGAARTLVQRLLDELPAPGPARWPAGPGLELRRYRGRLRVEPCDQAASGARAPPADVSAPPAQLIITGPGRWELSAGVLIAEPALTGGVAIARLQQAELRMRAGGERFQRAAGTPPRSLKKQFQAAAVPAWQRAAPLLFAGGRLVFVPGLGLDARALAAPGEPRLALRWLPRAAG